MIPFTAEHRRLLDRWLHGSLGPQINRERAEALGAALAHIDELKAERDAAIERPIEYVCDHTHWRSVRQDGRHCSCGQLMFDPGD